MSSTIEIPIPTIPTSFPKIERVYPISEGENLLRALRHEKPLGCQTLRTAAKWGPSAKIWTKATAHCRMYKAVRDANVIPMMHNCGLINDFIPCIVEEIEVDALEIQPINDIKGILQKYGTRCTVEYSRPDPYFFFDPRTTTAQLKEKAREIVDLYGAHTNPGAGAC